MDRRVQGAEGECQKRWPYFLLGLLGYIGHPVSIFRLAKAGPVEASVKAPMIMCGSRPWRNSNQDFYSLSR
jgi:hypothetical protein